MPKMVYTARDLDTHGGKNPLGMRLRELDVQIGRGIYVILVPGAAYSSRGNNVDPKGS